MTNYNLTNFTSANNTLQYLQAVNDLTTGSFVVFIVVMIWLITFTAMKNYSSDKALISAGFVTLLLTGMFWVVGLAGNTLLGVAFGAFALGVIANLFS